MTLPQISQSPTDPDFVQNPYPFYDSARALGPFVFWSDYEMAATTTHAATSAILRDRRFGREVPSEMRGATPDHLADFYALEAHSMLELEPPRHTRLRGLVLRAFTSRRIASLGPETETLCHALIDKMHRRDTDVLQTYCIPIPVSIIARLLGVPDSIAPDLLRWSNAMASMYQARRTPEIETAATEAARDFAAFMRSYVEDRRSTPADDLITQLIAAEQEGERLSTDELITTCILLLNAGHEATVHSMGNGVKTLLEQGFTGNDLAAGNMAAIVEELLRFDPPLHMFTRYCYETVELFGHRFERGDQVACLLAAAGRDPAAYDEPNRFDPTRAGPPNVAFGAGIHFCVGAPLARLELQIGLKTLFARCPNLRLLDQPQYANLYHFHGLKSLNVTAQ